ncbi:MULTISPECIES: DUF3189 family protein [Bacillus]|uniref:DUF3189 family protein n=1 Tax=Bacillus TaxID=1386 RepID=UPI00047E1813|nr:MULTISPECIES: DUF3189 family protein [Bacillus]QHZ49126.1 DUF3189 family protein [Bacillus sp. NSP9.1]WFA07481.1 DUF3189 family protein [Bacillus sp. HSf4]
MIYIYNCYGGTHSSALAAAYHLKKLPLSRKPTKNEILNTDCFNRLSPKEMGKLIYHGLDEEGSKVYTIGRGSSKAVIPAMRGVLELFENSGMLSEKVIFSNTSPTVPLAMTFGGLFSRRLKIDPLGVPLLVLGSQQAYQDIIQLVERTKKHAKTTSSFIDVLDNGFLD